MCKSKLCVTCGNSPDGLPVATIQFTDNGHDGAGWYYWDPEYPEEGSVGPFPTREDAATHAVGEGYRAESV